MNESIKSNSYEHLVCLTEQLHLDVCEIKTAITGGLNGKPGLNDRIRVVEIGITDLQAWREDHRRRLNNFLWKVAASVFVGGGLFGFILKILPKIIG